MVKSEIHKILFAPPVEDAAVRCPARPIGPEDRIGVAPADGMGYVGTIVLGSKPNTLTHQHSNTLTL